MSVDIPGVVSILVFYALTLAVGIWAGRRSGKNSTVVEVFLANRNMGLLVSLFTLTGSTISVIMDLSDILSITVSAVVAVVYTFLGGLRSVAYTDIVQLVCIAVGLAIACPFAVRNAAVDFSKLGSSWVGQVPTDQVGIFVDLFAVVALGGIPWQASDRELVWVLRVAILVVGVLNTGIAILARSVYGLYVMCSDLMYVILFPQFTCVLFLPGTNSYGGLAGFVISLLLRFFGGESLIGLPAVLKFPLYSEQHGQRFPFRTVAMLCNLLAIVLGSKLTHVAFNRGWLSPSLDILHSFSPPPPPTCAKYPAKEMKHPFTDNISGEVTFTMQQTLVKNENHVEDCSLDDDVSDVYSTTRGMTHKLDACTSLLPSTA